jgi:hypothetical protein
MIMCPGRDFNRTLSELPFDPTSSLYHFDATEFLIDIFVSSEGTWAIQISNKGSAEFNMCIPSNIP